jgi:membrane protein YdbS with pleckstrin-like domain
MNYIDGVKRQIIMYIITVIVIIISCKIAIYMQDLTPPAITTNQIVTIITSTITYIFITPLYYKWLFNKY